MKNRIGPDVYTSEEPKRAAVSDSKGRTYIFADAASMLAFVQKAVDNRIAASWDSDDGSEGEISRHSYRKASR